MEPSSQGELAGGALRRAKRFKQRQRESWKLSPDTPRLNLVQAYMRTIRGSRV